VPEDTDHPPADPIADPDGQPPPPPPPEAPPEADIEAPAEADTETPPEADTEAPPVADTETPPEGEAPAAGGATFRGLVLTAGVLAGLLVAVIVACSFIGQVGISWGVWKFRVLRAMAAAVVGAALAAAGVALQSLLRNPLASPFILGISSGAAVGVLVSMTVFQTAMWWAGGPAMALAGALVTLAGVYLLAQRRGGLDPYSLLLTGVIVNAFNGAIMLLLQLYASPYVRSDYVTWAMGQIPESPSVALLATTAGLTLIGWGYLFSRANAFNVQSLGDDVATSSGVNVALLRLCTFAAAGLMAAAAVALAGPIGFVGLIVPHLCRMALGSDHRRLVIASGFVGAILLVAADTFCRATVLVFRGELPVGVITAVCGGPFFLALLRRQIRGATV